MKRGGRLNEERVFYDVHGSYVFWCETGLEESEMD